jgi:hypothetical protein
MTRPAPCATLPDGMQRKRLPIGIQTFRKIRESGSYYVDKTPFAIQLIDEGETYFLSRPRRFGKSLFIDTLKELFEGNRPLFEGLYAEHHWDWSVRYPVVRLSFGGGVLETPEDFAASVHGQLRELEQAHDLPAEASELRGRLRSLIRRLHEKTGQRVVALVDEYDKPILDNLGHPDRARYMGDRLRDLYSVLKDADAHLRFVFLTGVSKFSKVSLFSGLNNLNDITLDRAYSAVCGYTEEDLDAVFAPELRDLDRAEVRRWYNGYNWLGTPVYNPFDLLLLLQKRTFRAWWFETATPTFLIDLLARRQLFTPRLARLQTSEALLSSFDLERIEPEALLWQAGYLTIRDVSQQLSGRSTYLLGYPNAEVEASLNEALVPALGPEAGPAEASRTALEDALKGGDFEGAQAAIHALFASIPHDWYRNNPLAHYEGHYASVFYSHLAAMGLSLTVEDATNKGRVDLALRLGSRVCLFEFKVVEQVPEGRALAQLQARRYAEKYRAPGVMVTLIGVEFSREARNIVAFEVAEG